MTGHGIRNIGVEKTGDGLKAEQSLLARGLRQVSSLPVTVLDACFDSVITMCPSVILLGFKNDHNFNECASSTTFRCL